jgi:hypothetical protein
LTALDSLLFVLAAAFLCITFLDAEESRTFSALLSISLA